MELDPVLIARIQFAFTVSFHIIFPSFSIGLAAFIATLEGVWLVTKNERYHQLARFWTKVFAVTFAMGVVSGIVITYQFGTNWSEFSLVVGNVLGPVIGLEVLTAFFLEATFLGVMLFGWNKVSPRMHFASSVIVAVGTVVSAFWILSANSWMQHPVGYEMRDGIAFPTDWMEIIFNPVFPMRFAHMVIAAYLTIAFVVLAVGARYLIRNRHVEMAETMVKMGLGLALVLAPLQILTGDFAGLNVHEHQPAKLAAMEGHWDSDKPAPLVLFGIPNPETQSNDFEIAIPNLGSLIITHSLTGTFTGLNDIPRDEWPPLLLTFFSFRVMVGIGFAMLGVAALGGLLWMRGTLFQQLWYHRIIAYAWPLGFVAIIAGWFTAEVGRQPWIVNGLLRTADAISPVSGAMMLASLCLFVVVYFVIFGAGGYYINRLIEKGPSAHTQSVQRGQPKRPLSAAHAAARHAAHSQY